MMNPEEDEAYGWSDGSKDKARVCYVIHDDGSAMISESETESESESEWKTSSYKVDVDDVEIGGPWIIYPGLDLDHYSYRHSHVLHFSKTAIANYNRDTVCTIILV